MQEYSSSKSEMTELYQISENYEKYMGKEMERQVLFNFYFLTNNLLTFFILLTYAVS